MKAVNLLPPDLRTAAKKPAAAGGAPATPAAGGAGPYAVIGALTLGVIALAAYVLVGNTVKDRQAELARVQAEHAAMKTKVAALKPYADFQQMALARVATVQALATSRFDWEQALRDLSEAMPSNVHLTALNGSVSGNAGSAGAAAAQRGTPAVPTLKMQGCTKTHSDVARLMSRLRTIRGVTRVSLASSDKEGSGGVAAPTTTAADGGRPAQTCPKGSPPSFDLTVMFGRSTATASGAVAAPAGAASATATAPGQAQGAAQPGATPAAGAAPGNAAAPAASAAPAPATANSAPQGGTP